MQGKAVSIEQINGIKGLVKVFKDNIFTTFNVCLPAIVTKYNLSQNTVNLQLAIQVLLTDGEYKDRPQIFDIPVLELGGNDLSIKFPLKKDDTGIVIFCDRDITLFKQEKKNTQPQTLRKHDLADGIFIPMKFGNSGSSNIVIENSNGNTKLEVTSSGINIKGNVTIDGNITVADVKTDVVSSLNTHVHGGVTTGSGTTGTPQ